MYIMIITRKSELWYVKYRKKKPKQKFRLLIMSGRRGSNSRQPAWKAGALPTELLPHYCDANIDI